MFLDSSSMYVGILGEHILEFRNPIVPVHGMYLACLLDFVVMLGSSL